MNSQKIPMRLKIRQLVTIIIVGIIVIWFLAPLVLITISAFASPSDYYQIEKVIPTHFTLNQFKSLFFGLEAWKAILTSMKVAGLTMLLSFIIGLPAGYALSRYFPREEFFKIDMSCYQDVTFNGFGCSFAYHFYENGGQRFNLGHFFGTYCNGITYNYPYIFKHSIGRICRL
jgi:ABC-type uncharacterized transport system permease subunit